MEQIGADDIRTQIPSKWRTDPQMVLPCNRMPFNECKGKSLMQVTQMHLKNIIQRKSTQEFAPPDCI